MTSVPRHLHQHTVSNRLKPYSIKFKDKEIDSLSTCLCDRFGWSTARSFQLEGIRAQLTGRDAIIHVATSMGKTAVAAGPFVLPSAADLMIIYIIPLLALQDEMATTFPAEFGVSAVAVNSQVTDSTSKLMEDIVDGKYRVILVSPESLLSPRFIKHVLSSSRFAQKVLSVVIDEAHCVSLYGAGFRKLYGSLYMLRTFLPQGLPFVALSATLTPRVRLDLVDRLQLQPDYILINEGNDRNNVTLVVRKCIHPLDSYRDAGFVIPSSIKAAPDILKTFFYVDNIDASTGIVDYLTGLLPERLQIEGLIRPYNATFSTDYRQQVMEQFRQGVVRVLVCTDAAGMGCNIPDVSLVVQWRVPESIETFQQRAGRAARDKSLTGMVVLLAEPHAYKVDPTEPADLVDPVTDTQQQGGKSKKKKKRKRGRRTKMKKKVEVGAEPTEPAQPEIRADSPGGGIYVFVQTPLCRRAVIARIFGNPSGNLTAPCCDYCNPSVLLSVAPPPREKQRRVNRSKEGEIDRTLQTVLTEWREEVCERDYSHSLWAPDAFLDDDTIDSIACRSNVGDERALAAILDGYWHYWSQYGPEMLARIQATVPQVPAPLQQPKKTRTPKQPHQTTDTANPSVLATSSGSTIISESTKKGRGKRPAPGVTRTERAKRQKKEKGNVLDLPQDTAAAEVRLIQIQPAPEHLQMPISVSRVPPGMIRVVPSQRHLIPPARRSIWSGENTYVS